MHQTELELRHGILVLRLPSLIVAVRDLCQTSERANTVQTRELCTVRSSALVDIRLRPGLVHF